MYHKGFIGKAYHKECIAKDVSQIVYCKGCITKGVLQGVYHKGCIVKCVLQNVYLKYDLLRQFFLKSSFDIHTHERYKMNYFSFMCHLVTKYCRGKNILF